MYRVHKAKNKQLLTSLALIQEEAHKLSADFQKFKENTKNMLNWKNIQGKNTAIFQKLSEKVEEIEGKEQENVWLRGRTEILTSERDSMMSLFESLKADKLQLTDTLQKNKILNESVTILTDKVSILSIEKEKEYQEKIKTQLRLQEVECSSQTEISEIKNKNKELNEIIKKMKEREENCVLLEIENENVKNHFMELNENIQTLEYERTELEQQSEELMKKLENEKRRNESLESQISEIQRKNQQKEDQIKEKIKALEAETVELKSRALLAEENLKANNSHKSM
eukprot:c20978_g1_i1.p1 GENE.c20978_g1_i1~~c20978_g1_i1.p1  ORF type:complete len:284 (-),score=105.08 c20978_g1_i1:16-867(-)